MSAKETGGPAFPKPNFLLPSGELEWGNEGMSLRDYFAAKAMQFANDGVYGGVGQIAEELGITPEKYDVNIHWPMLIAKRAYQYADAMIAERNK